VTGPPALFIVIELGSPPRFRVLASSEREENELRDWLRSCPDLNAAIADLLGPTSEDEAT
jgi:hypothetical protein